MGRPFKGRNGTTIGNPAPARLNWGTTWDGNGTAHMHHLMKALQSPPMIGLSTTLSLPQNNAPHQMPFLGLGQHSN
ncbi:hypothetical protein FXO38_06854, partial [Capsicum annuum]